jgi:ABC-type Zn uptake system ZnuABC Zn-binding protein ZnuA
MRLRPIVLLVAAALVASACGTDDSTAEDGERLVIATTVSPLTNIVSNIVGDLADVRGVVPEGVDSHTFEPSPSVARTLAEADIVFVNGLGLETPTIELAHANIQADAEIIELGPQTVDPDEYVFDRDFPAEDGDPNPHLWTHPPHAKRYAEIITEVMVRRDAPNAQAFEDNLEAFSERADDLERALREATETVLPQNRKLLTYHDSFPYLPEYGWTILGAIQPSDFSEPSPREVADLITQIREEEVPAIFGSEVFPSPVLEQIARETGADYFDDLRDDELPASPGDPTHTWMEMMVFNFRTIVEALGGDASVFDDVDTTDVAPDVATYA